MKPHKKFDDAIRPIIHLNEVLVALSTLTPQQLKALEKAARARRGVIAEAGRRQAAAILGAKTMGAPRTKYAEKHAVSEALLMGTKHIRKASAKLTKSAKSAKEQKRPIAVV